MTAQVINFGQMTEEQVAKVAEAGVDLRVPVNVTEMGLTEPEYGEDFVDFATDEEASIYYQMWQTFQVAERGFRKAVGDALVRGGHALAESDLKQNIVEALRGDEGTNVYFENDEKAEEFSKVAQRHAFLKALLYYKVGERLGMHSWHLGFRRPKSGSDSLRVVKTKKRWDAGS